MTSERGKKRRGKWEVGHKNIDEKILGALNKAGI